MCCLQLSCFQRTQNGTKDDKKWSRKRIKMARSEIRERTDPFVLWDSAGSKLTMFALTLFAWTNCNVRCVVYVLSTVLCILQFWTGQTSDKWISIQIHAISQHLQRTWIRVALTLSSWSYYEQLKWKWSSFTSHKVMCAAHSMQRLQMNE